MEKNPKIPFSLSFSLLPRNQVKKTTTTYFSLEGAAEPEVRETIWKRVSERVGSPLTPRGPSIIPSLKSLKIIVFIV